MAQILTFRDFSGGITDYYLDAEINRYEKADNLLIFKHGNIGKLITRPGSTVYHSADEQLPSGSQRVGNFFYMNSVLMARSGRNLYRDDGSDWTNEIVGPVDSNKLLPSTADDETNLSHDYWNNHLFIADSDFHKPSKVFYDGSNWQLRTAGLPDLASSPTVTPSGGTGSSYVYRFLYKIEYTVGTVTYIDRGPITEVSSGDTGMPGTNQIDIASIPTLSNGATTNYDTSTTLKIEIYRTSDGGTIFYKLGEVNNGTTTYTDTTDDVTANELLYTEGGVVENDPPPLSKLVHITEDKAYWANVKLGSEERNNRVYQSIPGDPDSVPSTFFVDVDDEIVGMSSVRGRVVLLCANSVYRVDGAFDELGRGALTSQQISTRASCVSSLSVVQTLEGVYWAGRDGFYFTDGYQVLRINDGWDKSYRDIIGTDLFNSRIYGAYDRKKQRVWWACGKDVDATDNDYCYVLDLNFVRGPDMPFTGIADNGNNSWQPSALIFVDGDMVRGDVRGYIFQHDDNQFTDPKVDTTVAATSWDIETIIYDFISAATTFGNHGIRKLVTRTGVISDNDTNLSLQIVNITDDGRQSISAKPIRSRGGLIWGEENALWGDDTIIWGLDGVIDAWRRVGAAALRCNYHQVKLTNAFVAIFNSDSIDTADVDANNSQATLTDTATYDWPSNINDYVIAFDDDNYVQEYTITARTADTITFDDGGNNAVDGSATGWVIRGKPKGEVLSLISFTLHYEVFGRTQNFYSQAASATGENS